MKILLLGHREIASNLAISLLVQGLRDYDLRIALSGAGEAPSGELPAELAELNQVEQAMCDALDSGHYALAAGRLGLFGFDSLQAQIGTPIEILDDPNSPAGLTRVRQWAPDLVLSVRYRKILHENFLAIPRLGVLNLHSGLLPEFRGVMATFHSLLLGNHQIGATLHSIDDRKIDSGEVIGLYPMKPRPGDSYLLSVLRLYPFSVPEMVVAARTLIEGKSLKKQVQPLSTSYYKTPTAPQCQAFRDAGFRFCDGAELENLLGLTQTES